MNKTLGLVVACGLVGACIGGSSSYSYRLLPSTLADKVVVEETISETVDGYGSYGSTSYHKTKKRERTLELQEAFDIGVRHKCQPILAEAIRKMAKKGDKVDMTDALEIVIDALKQARSGRTGMYVLGGITGAFASVPWFLPNSTNYNAGSGVALGPVHVDASVVVGNIVASGIVLSMAGAIALSGWWQFRSACKAYRAITEQLFAAKHVCVIGDSARVSQNLALISGLLGTPLGVSVA